MRVLHVVPTYLPATRYGGPIVAVHGLARSLAARGHDVTVFTTNVDGAGTSDVPLDCDVVLDGVRIRYFSANGGRRLYRSPAMGRALRHAAQRFDVVHAHSVFLWPTWAASRAAAAAGVPSVVSPRGMLVKELIARKSRFVKSCWLSLVEKRNLERAAAIHVTSTVEEAELARFGWRLPPIVTIGNGIDIPAECGGPVSADIDALTARKPYALFLGRLSWKKGIDRLLEAFACTRTGTLVIAGNDDEGMAPSIKSRIAELGLGDRVRLRPHAVHGADKQALFRNASLFVLPSYSENFGNTVPEAMINGLPVVVTPEVGASDIVRKADAGIVCPGEPSILAAAIERLMVSPGLARTLGEQGRRYVDEHLQWSSVAKDMEGLYEAVTAGVPHRLGNRDAGVSGRVQER